MPEESIDPKEAMLHIRTLARTGQDCTDLDAARKHFDPDARGQGDAESPKIEPPFR